MNKLNKGVLFWTISMYIFMTFIFPTLEGSEITLKKALIAIPVWIVGGLGMAYANKKYKQK